MIAPHGGDDFRRTGTHHLALYAISETIVLGFGCALGRHFETA
jgi:hypothetical protein